MKKYILLVAFLCVVSACKTKTEIKGDIFVEVDGAVNSKIAGVHISAVPESSAKAYLDSKKNGFDTLKAEYYAATAFNKNADAEFRKADGVEEKLKEFTGADFYNGMPAGIALATSDVDGKFTLTLPKKEKYLIVAASSGYYWFVWVRADGRPQDIMLTNNNQMIAFSFETLFIN